MVVAASHFRHVVRHRAVAAGVTSRRDDRAMRIHERLDELYAIGGGVGANRVAGTSGEDTAHELAAQWLEEAGLAVEVDSAGNLIGRSADTSVWTGSHLDSVPYGGKFDGALGVVAALSWSSATRSVVASGAQPSPTASNSPNASWRCTSNRGPCWSAQAPRSGSRWASSGSCAASAHLKDAPVMPGRSRCWDERTPSSPPPSTCSAPVPRRSRSKVRSQPSARWTSSPER